MNETPTAGKSCWLGFAAPGALFPGREIIDFKGDCGGCGLVCTPDLQATTLATFRADDRIRVFDAGKIRAAAEVILTVRLTEKFAIAIELVIELLSVASQEMINCF